MNKYILAFLTASSAAALHAQVAGTNALITATNAAGTTNAAAAASTATRSGSSDWLGYAIWGGVIAAIFGFLWAKGYLVRMRSYVEETQEELKKCSWPTRDELKGSTVVVMVTIILLGVFTVLVDFVLSRVMQLIT